MKKANRIPPELDQLCIEVGKFIEYWGFKQIEGRLWCHLLLSKRPLCPNDFMERTGVSKGLVSISLARLLEYNVIRLEFTQGKRTQYYQVNENVTEVIKDVLRSRERRMLAGIEQAVALLKRVPAKDLAELSFKRIDFLLKFVKKASYYLEIMLFGGEKIAGFLFEKAPAIKQ